MEYRLTVLPYVKDMVKLIVTLTASFFSSLTVSSSSPMVDNSGDSVCYQKLVIIRRTVLYYWCNCYNHKIPCIVLQL